jgi:DNA-binding CsgD family transcriptional regulator
MGEHGYAAMSKHTIILTMLSILWCYLGYKTIQIDNRNRVYRLFGALCLVMTVWTFSIGIVYSLERLDIIHVLLKIGYIGGFLYSPVILHFFLLISKIPIKPYYLVLNYLPYVVLTVFNWIDFFVFNRIIRHENEWLGLINTDSCLMHFYVLCLFLTYVFALLVLFRWKKNAGTNKEKKQSAYIMIFFSVCFCSSYVLTLILPYFDIHKYQSIGVAVFDFFVIGLFFLIYRFRFMDLRGTLSSDEIISNMSEFVFILDNDLKIVECNSGALSLRHECGMKKRNDSFTDMMMESGEFNFRIRSVLSGETNNFTTLINFKTGSKMLHTKTYITGIKDRFNDIAGLLVVSNEIRDMQKFQEKFGITVRELEITGLVVSGSTYREISEKLGISERTVERHLVNIYNKLGIGNKIELYRIAEMYNIRI